MRTFSRADTSLLSQWWWTVDRWTVSAIGLLIMVGFFLILASSPSVAEHLHLDSFYFVKRQAVFLLLGLGVLISVSLLSPKNIQRLSLFIYLGGIGFLILIPLVGAEVKGARRWVSLAGVSIQPSEFIKPALVVLCAWMLAEKRKQVDFPGNLAAVVFYALVVGLLLLQPDMGMIVLMTLILFGQFFLAGLPFRWIVGGILVSVSGLVAAYFTFPHVSRRVDRFLDPTSGDRFSDRYQITQSLEAFINGGIFGQGPGEGTVKSHLPDAHSDFIFAVAGEEFGLILCVFIVGLFGFITLRCLIRLLQEEDFFVVLAVSGLVMEFGLQAVINIASTVHLIPTKGMTLPFISYGGSSLLALGVTMGMLLGLTRRRVALSRG